MSRHDAGALLRRWLVLALGALTLMTGVAASINAGIGTGSWQALETGLVATTGLGLGWVVVLESLVALAVAWLLLDQPPGPATVLIALAGGPVIQAMTGVLPMAEGWPGGLAMLVVGSLAIGVGVGLYVPAELGPTAQDSLFVGLYRKLGWRPGVAKFLSDAALVVVGWILGGQVGVGTVIVTLLVPPVVDVVLPRGHRLAGTMGPAPVATTTAI